MFCITTDYIKCANDKYSSCYILCKKKYTDQRNWYDGVLGLLPYLCIHLYFNWRAGIFSSKTNRLCVFANRRISSQMTYTNAENTCCLTCDIFMTSSLVCICSLYYFSRHQGLSLFQFIYGLYFIDIYWQIEIYMRTNLYFCYLLSYVCLSSLNLLNPATFSLY